MTEMFGHAPAIGSEGLTGIFFIISGPSGVGKGTIMKLLQEKYKDFVYPVSHTTREMRPGEKDGEVYYFVSRESFEQGIAAGEFLEWAKVHETNYYGTLKAPVLEALKAGKIVVRELDVVGAQSVQKVLDPRNVVTIFLKAEDTDELLRRIVGRGALPPDELERRMRSARREMQEAESFKYVAESRRDQIEECFVEVEKVFFEEAEKAGLKIG